MKAAPLSVWFSFLIIGTPLVSAEARCPTEADLETGILLKHGDPSAVSTEEPLPQEIAEFLGLSNDPKVSEYRLSTWKMDAVRWNARTTYKGLITISSMTDGTFVLIKYDSVLGDIFPLAVGESHELEAILYAPSFDSDGNILELDGRGSAAGTTVIEAVTESQLTVADCPFDTIVVKITATFEADNGSEGETSIGYMYYEPRLMFVLAVANLEGASFEPDQVPSQIRILQPHEKWLAE